MAKLPSLKKSSATPRKQVKGTTLSSGQAVNVDKAAYSELGSQRLSPIVDPVPALSNRQQELRTYKQMIRGDVSVRSSLRAGKASILGAEFYVEPYSAEVDDQIVWECVSDNIFYGSNLPWTKTLEGIVRFLENGFSVFEDVWELREWGPRKTSPAANTKQYTMLRKLAERPARTIGSFEYDDNGGLVGVHQLAINSNNQATDVLIPIEKCIIFTFEGDGNVEGESILRPAYRNWYYKDKLYTIDAIQKERHGIGVPEVEVLPGATKADKALAAELASNLRTNERAYIVRPSTLTVGFAELQGNPVNALESAEHHDNQIMKNILVQFINMGITSSGGRATGATAFDMFMKAMRYIANMICDYINMFLIPKIVAYNFPTNRFPKLQVRNIGETKDFQMWSAGIRNLMSANGITPDMPTEQFLRKVADMPLKTEPRPLLSADTAQTREQILLQGQTGNTSGTPTTTPTTKPGAAPAAIPPPKQNKSNNGGAGNVGKSPSSGG